MQITCKTCFNTLYFTPDNLFSVFNVLTHTQSHKHTIADIIENSCIPFFNIETVKQKAGIFASPESLQLSCKKCQEVLLIDKKANGFALSPIVTHLLGHYDIQYIINTIIKPYYNICPMTV